jgi:hypothetical protein
MRTNSKEVTQAIQKHILESVYDYNENLFTNFSDAKNHLINEFNRVSNHNNNIKRIPNKQERFSDYLNGIPFHFEYMNDSIKEFLNSLGINKDNKSFSDAKSVKLYHFLIFRELKDL